jgi:very-short-patch-repair endonuclease
MTLPEVLLWQRLSRNRIGAKFRKQHAIPPYVVDFYCASAKLIVEVDGRAHDSAERQERDAARDRFLIESGYEVSRLRAFDILNAMDSALSAIAARIESPLHRASGTVPLPTSGEDLR